MARFTPTPVVVVEVKRFREELSKPPGQIVILAEQKGKCVIPTDNLDHGPRMLDGNVRLPEASVSVCEGMDVEVGRIDFDIVLEPGQHAPRELNATAVDYFTEPCAREPCLTGELVGLGTRVEHQLRGPLSFVEDDIIHIGE